MQQMGKLGGQSMLVFSSVKKEIKLRVDESWTNNKVQHEISISKSLLILNFFIMFGGTHKTLEQCCD
jgi:hypothetical protein